MVGVVIDHEETRTSVLFAVNADRLLEKGSD